MHREIKFRIWDKRNEEWNNGIAMSSHNGQLITNHNEDFELMQYTGLKDKNGKEIYEGDIIQRVLKISGKIDIQAEVYFDKKHAGFMVKGKGTEGYNKQLGIINEMFSDGPIFEVIGNIYENPDLMN